MELVPFATRQPAAYAISRILDTACCATAAAVARVVPAAVVARGAVVATAHTPELLDG